MLLHTGLHTWYVGARTAPATIRGFTDRRVPPTCRRQAGRKDIAGRLSEHCLVKTHVFDQPDAEPEHLTAEDVRNLLPL